MVRETRHLWVGNLPENIREERIREHFKRYGRVQSVKLLSGRGADEKTASGGEITMACTVAFMDIKSAAKAHNAELKIDDRTLDTEYYEPAAIPSAASPQNTPSPYSTSPAGANRFPNGHGSSSEEHVTAASSFSERFYDRPAASSRLAAPSATAAPCAAAAPYHDAATTAATRGARPRATDRPAAYRNGPVPPGAAAGAAGGPVGGGAGTAPPGAATGCWGYESSSSSRYNSTSSNSQADTGYSTTPSENNERRNSDQSSKKKTKSRSGSRSPSPSGSTISRSPSRSRSRSSSSSSSSTTSRDTSSTGSPKSRRLASSSSTGANHQPVVHSDDRRPLAICVRNLPARSSDSSLKDGLFHEYKKHGKVTWVKVVGKDAERHAIVCFKKPEDVEKALEVSYDKLFFGCKIEVAPYQCYDVDDNDQRPYEAEIDEYHPKATRTLFIGNLEKDVTASDLRKHFDQFGEIIEIDVKKQGAVSSYAFCQYTDIASVVKAIRQMDGEHLGNNRIKLGFGKSMPYAIVWVDGVGEGVTEKYLKMQFETFGVISKVYVDREKGQALVVFEQLLNAQASVTKMRGFSLKGGKIQVDFASRECTEAFFERLERQGAAVDRSIFEERSVGTRSFDASNASRFSRYCDSTPTARARTSSYSSRSGGAPGGQTALQSPGGGAPIALASRSRRFAADFYEQAAGAAAADYDAGRHSRLRGYDEYSQGSAASHEDAYEYEFARDVSSPVRADALADVAAAATTAFAPPDMRHLQKERVHLLEQLEECPSSGDELVSPKKRLKLDLLDAVIAGEVIVEANRDHRKVIEVRRLSDAGPKHHSSSRRPSTDSGGGGKHLRHDAAYLPHAVCKRRKTAGSDGGRPSAHDRRSGSESAGGGSRPGTPLCDERPENFPPSEPRRGGGAGRERDGPLSLPLPRFAAQLVNRGVVSVAGIKGQTAALSSPPSAVTSPRVSCVARPPSPTPVPPPASPPPRPPSRPGSDSSDGGGDASLDERIRSLDERYERWSGSRAAGAAGGDALGLLDERLERFRRRHKILDLDLKEVQPSEIVKSVMAKRSVFDEDLKRLENVGEKYEPKEFPLFPKAAAALPPQACVVAAAALVAAQPASKLAVVAQAPKTPVVLSPRSTGTSLPAAKGLQYPFPTHPPILMSPVPPPPPPTAPTPAPPACPAAPPATTAPATVGTTSASENRLKPCDAKNSSKINVNKNTVVSSVKTSASDPSDAGAESDVNEERKRERFEKIKQENEKLEREKSERERIERERLENERLEKIRIEKERLEKERLERESELEKQRLEKERLEKERLEKERERAEKEKAAKERAEKEKQELERLQKEKLEKERLEKEIEEKQRREREEQQEKERIEREAEETARKEREERERKAKEEAERLDKEKQEWERKREEERTRHKDDNQDRRKDDHKHRETHSDSKHRDNNVDKHLIDNGNTKETGSSSTNHDKSKSHADRDIDRRKESVKENRDNNVHDKHKSISESSNKSFVESRHMSIDFDKSKSDSSKRKERNNSLPANIGSKRRLSAHEISEPIEDNKKTKLCFEHKKLPERRDSKDSTRSEDRLKSSKHKNNVIRSHNSDEKRKEKEERHKKHKLEKQKSKSKSREKESHESIPKSPLTDKDFLNRLDLRPTSEDAEKHQKSAEKRKNNLSSEEHDRTKKDKELSKTRFETDPNFKTGEEKKKRDRIRKFTNSSDTDSDEPKKHSIFDIVDDEPAYISMYDKVKARSCKNMAKLEEEKRQEKLKAKFTQLKQSRAKREEKKRSTSWDEDSDYDKDPSEIKIKKASKMLIDSTDDESLDRKSRKKKEIYSDSDCSGILKHVKQEPLDTSEDESKIKCMIIKGMKSRITSDTSEDEYNKKKSQVKTEIFSDADNSQMQMFEEKRSIKDELERLIKKERRNSKHQESPTETHTQIFNNTDPLEIKTEKYLHDNTSDEEAHEIAKKERSERREKKHKKKQKKQKHSVSSEESVRADSVLDSVSTENPDKDKTKHEKKKDHSRKEKRRDKTREGRDKPKKSKKNKSDSKSEVKREGKMENIFGSFSEDSENGTKDATNISVDHENHNQIPYHSDSDKEHDHKTKEKSEKDREREEHHRKRKEKKRREKERRLQEAAAEPNENSMDYADMGKQLEANMMQDENLDAAQETNKEIDSSNFENPNDTFSFTEAVDESEHKKDKEERREGKEKKKKRKKSKDEKSKHHHHEKHHHHDKNKNKASEAKKETAPSVEEIKVEPPPTPPQNPSLPTILDETSPADKSAVTPDFSVSPMNPIISPIPNTPTTSKEKKREKLLPGFGTELDEKLHESAVKSISELEVARDALNDEDCLSEQSLPLPEEKPRVVISQEETEDAVAALLGESFGGGKQDEFYSDDGAVNDAPEENPVQDDEEMRQAVQSLSASDLDVKPDTPQSEHELQIDTDTEEQEETPVQPSKTAEKVAPPLSQLPKTPTYFRHVEEPAKLSPLVLKNPPNIGSPPSLTPIRPQSVKLVEIRKPLDLEQKSLPLLPDQTQRTVITQSWAAEKKPEAAIPIPQPSVIKIETKKVPVPPLAEVQLLNKPINAPSARPYPAPILKIAEPQYPPLKPLSKPDQLTVSPVSDPKALPISAKSPNALPQMHNLPARSPVQINKPAASEQGMLSPKLPPNLVHNRLPITPVLASKPMQATTVKLQQAKVAHSLEPPKLVPASDHRPRMIFQNSPQFTSFPANQPRMMIQGNIRHLPPQGLLVPTRQLTPQNFGYLGNIPHANYGLSPIIKENVAEHVTERNNSDKLPGVVVSTASSLAPSRVTINVPQHLSMQPLIIPKEIASLPPTGSPKQPLNQFSPRLNSPSPKPAQPLSPTPRSISQAPSPRLVSSPLTVPASPNPKPVTDPSTCSQIEAPVQPSIIQAIPKLEIPPPAQPEPPQLIVPEPKTSIPSPVIVPVVKDEPIPAKSEEHPVKLAIEMLTDELNMALGKASPEIKPVEEKSEDKSNKEDPVDKSDTVEAVELELEDTKPADTKVVDTKPVEESTEKPPEATTIIKDIEKFDEEKADTESIVSDISKERPGSADILAKEDPLDTKEDSDYWSAKEVNIDSVIKTLCSADELSDRSSEIGKDEWFDETTKPDIVPELTPEKKEQPPVIEESELVPDETEEPKEQISPLRASSRTRGARGGRGRGKARGGTVERGGIQTRRGKMAKELAVAIPPPNKRGRGARGRNERKSVKSESEVAPTDVYEFRDESDDANKERPRLILTIKSPAVANSNNSLTTAIVKEVTKDGAKEIGKEHVIKDTAPKSIEAKEEFPTPTSTTNTRKSRRLQEKDTKSTVDDTIEDVVKNTVLTRSSSNQRRSTRQTVPKPTAAQPETPRKSPRGRKLRRGSEATENSSSEETIKEDVKPPTPPVKPKEIEKPSETLNPEEPVAPESIKEKPFEGLKAAMLRRIKGDLTSTNPEEPTNLIDPVTGELIPMRESEEGKYVPLPGDPKPPEPAKPQPTVIAQPQQITVVQPPKPQSLKAHVLSSQAAQAIVSQQLPKPTIVVPPPPQLVVVSKPGLQVGVPPLIISKAVPVTLPKTVTPIMMNKSVTSMVASKISAPVVITKPVTPINQHLTVNANLSVVTSVSSAARPAVVSTVSAKSVPKQLVKPPVLSPVMLQKQQILQIGKQQQQQLQQLVTKGHLVVSQAQMVNTHLAHAKHQPIMKQQVIMGAKGPIVKPLHQQQMLSGAVPSPPLTKSQSPMGGHPSRVIQGMSQAKVMEPPKVEVTMAGVMMGQRPKLSPQGPQQRLLGQAGVPMPAYEASLLGDRSLLNRSRSPPPAHQNSPSPKGEAIAHFPPGPLRQDINPAHYMHPSHVMQYQQYLRQQQLQHLTRTGGMEKVKDGQEGEEAPVTSPPLELRRPGSVGLALTGRGAAVPHSLHSPHDRATDSPQVGQVYNVHASRLPHYPHPGRYYEPSEPPPAHRPLTSHAGLAALGSDRPLGGHLSPMVPDRPLGGHSMIDRPRLPPQPTAGGLGGMGAGLGAAGNLMGAVARHVGADAPTTQRGLQAATPPHASQVPPQAESLLMLLKQYPCMWQGLLALKNDQAAVQMYFVSGNDDVAKCSLPKNTDGSTPPLRIFQRMRLEPLQVEGVARKMQMENEHCMLLALPCGHDHMDVLKQSTNLTGGFITYLQQKQAAGIVNVAAPGTTQPPAYVVHIFPSCDFVNENLRRIAPSLLERVADIAHLLIVITTV